MLLGPFDVEFHAVEIPAVCVIAGVLRVAVVVVVNEGVAALDVDATRPELGEKGTHLLGGGAVRHVAREQRHRATRAGGDVTRDARGVSRGAARETAGGRERGSGGMCGVWGGGR